MAKRTNRKRRKGARRGRVERLRVADVKQALIQTGGIYMRAAHLLNCSPNTVRNYVTRHSSLARLLEKEILPANIDMAEDALLAGIRDPKARGHVPFVMFYLRTKGKHRGYSERVESPANEQKPLPIAFYLPEEEPLDQAPTVRIKRGPNGEISRCEPWESEEVETGEDDDISDTDAG